MTPPAQAQARVSPATHIAIGIGAAQFVSMSARIATNSRALKNRIQNLRVSSAQTNRAAILSLITYVAYRRQRIVHGG